MLFKSGARANEPKDQTRLNLEQSSLLLLSGWCCGADKLPGTVELLLDGRPLAVEVKRLGRLDVCDALGTAADLAYGFQIEVPAAVWREAGMSARPLSLRVGSKTVPVDMPADLSAWLRALMSQAASETLERALRLCFNHIAELGGASVLQRLSADQRQWLIEGATERGLQAWLRDPSRPVPTLAEMRGAVEALDFATLRGWAMLESEHAPSLAHERFQVFCNGRLMDCAVVRTERDDVRAALGIKRLQLGFEIELPGLIWQLADDQGRCRLEVLLDHRPLPGSAFVFDKAAVLAAIEPHRQAELAYQNELRARPAAPPPGGAELQYTGLLLLEHVGQSGLLPALTPTHAAFMLQQAQRFGLSVGQLFGEQQAGRQQAPDLGAQHDLSERGMWLLLREFNSAMVADPSSAAATLQQIMSRSTVGGEVRYRFLIALLPFFAGLDAYDAIRPWLPMSRLRALCTSDNAWELSLPLPELVACADFAAAASTVEKLCRSSKGWLNTECVGQAARSLARQWLHDDLPAEHASYLVDQFKNLLASQGREYWLRLHDRHLIDTMVSLLELLPVLTPHQGYWVIQDALRHYALVPAFWDRLQQRLPHATAWPLALREARPVLDRLNAAVRGAEFGLDAAHLLRVLPQLRSLQTAGNVDAPMVARELVLAALPALARSGADELASAYAELGGLSIAEVLRLAAHPLATGSMLETAPDLADRIRAVSGVPSAPLRALRVDLLRELWRPGPQTSGLGVAAFHRLAGALDHHSGVRLAASHWVLGRASMTPEQRRSQLTELRELWMAARWQQSPDAILPTALYGAWQVLALAQRWQPEAELAGLLAEITAALPEADRQQGQLPPAEQVALACKDPLFSTLVVVYSCRRNLNSRVEFIRQTWAADLSAAGIPWLVVVGDGDPLADGELVDNVLSLPVSDAYEALPAKTLGLIDWVYRRTDFAHLLKIDDDCHLSVEAFFEQSSHLLHHYLGRRLHRAEGGTDRQWHQSKSATARGAAAIDKSPEPSLYADGGAGYSLSRLAMGRLQQVLATSAGSRLTRSAYLEDKLLGDLLAQAGIVLSSEDHETLVRRRTWPGAVPVNAFQNVFYAGSNSPTVIAHLDDATQLPAVQQALAGPLLKPARLWPSYAPPVLGGVDGSNQLELLSAAAGVDALYAAPVLVIAVARNERVLMPHFLAHYRALGVRHFVLVDNLSDDGTREYLLQQPDVVLYSADTQYRHSHFGVAWQQAVLAAHALGKWVVLADIDEFLVYPDSENLSIVDWLSTHDAEGADGVMTLMIDMYPQGELAAADFEQHAPFEVACWFDSQPLLPWKLGSGCFSNGPTYLSALRHRVIKDSAPNHYTSQKLAIFRYRPWVRLSEGLHYASNLNVAKQPAYFAHFKYHAGFKRKVEEEVARKQHFNGAEEYRKYLAMVSESEGALDVAGLSERYSASRSFNWKPS